MASAFQRALSYLSKFENKFYNAFMHLINPEALAPAIINFPSANPTKSKLKTLDELLKDSILWAVPKKRRTIEKRRSRRFGWPDRFYKMLVPKTNILICAKCGSYHEAGLLCPKCYDAVITETKKIQSAIEAELGISAVDTEVVVLYSDEEEKREIYQGKRIVELKRGKPKIFSDNLLQKSTQGPSDSKSVVKSDNINPQP